MWKWVLQVTLPTQAASLDYVSGSVSYLDLNWFSGVVVAVENLRRNLSQWFKLILEMWTLAIIMCWLCLYSVCTLILLVQNDLVWQNRVELDTNSKIGASILILFLMIWKKCLFAKSCHFQKSDSSGKSIRFLHQATLLSYINLLRMTKKTSPLAWAEFEIKIK